MRVPRIPPPVLALAGLLAQHLLARGRRVTAASGAVGLAGALASGALALGGDLIFHRAGTTISPITPSDATVLVRSGPFAVSRNPIYAGLLGLLVSHAVARRSAAALLPAAGFAVLMDRVQIPAEEEALKVVFGAPYEQYLHEVPRWGRIGPLGR